MDSDSQTNWETWAAEAAEIEKRVLISTSNPQPDQTMASRKRRPMMETSANPSSPKPLPTKVRLTTAGPQANAEELADDASAAITLTPPPAPPPQEGAALTTPPQQQARATESDSESESDQPTWQPIRLDDPTEEEERLKLILLEEMEEIAKLGGDQSTTRYLQAVAKRTGAEPAALWAVYKRLKYPAHTPKDIPRWPTKLPGPPLTARPDPIPEQSATQILPSSADAADDDPSPDTERDITMDPTQRPPPPPQLPSAASSDDTPAAPTDEVAGNTGKSTASETKNTPPHSKKTSKEESDEATRDRYGMSAKERESITSTQGQFKAYLVLFVPPPDLPPPQDKKQAAMGLVEDVAVASGFINAAADVGLEVKHFGSRNATRADEFGRNHFAIQAESEMLAAQAVDEMDPFSVPSRDGTFKIRFTMRLIGRRLDQKGEIEFFDPEDGEKKIELRSESDTSPRVSMARKSRGLPIKIYPNKARLGATSDVTASSLLLFLSILGFHAHYLHELLVKVGDTIVLGLRSGIWACELIFQNTPHHPTHPGNMSIQAACRSTTFPYFITHWQMLDGKRVNPIDLRYEIFGAPIGIGKDEMCKKCHQRQPHHCDGCPQAKVEARQVAQDRKRKFEEASSLRKDIIANANKTGKGIVACQQYMLGLCYEQLSCKKVHPTQDPERYKEIACKIEEPTSERKAKIGEWPHCKKGCECLYNHDEYGDAAVQEGRKLWNLVRMANRSPLQNRTEPDTQTQTQTAHTPQTDIEPSRRQESETTRTRSGGPIGDEPRRRMNETRNEATRRTPNQTHVPSAMTHGEAENIEDIIIVRHVPTTIDACQIVDTYQTIGHSVSKNGLSVGEDHREMCTPPVMTLSRAESREGTEEARPTRKVIVIQQILESSKHIANTRSKQSIKPIPTLDITCINKTLNKQYKHNYTDKKEQPKTDRRKK